MFNPSNWRFPDETSGLENQKEHFRKVLIVDNTNKQSLTIRIKLWIALGAITAITGRMSCRNTA